MRHNPYKSPSAPSTSGDATQGQPAWITPELIEETINLWKTRYRESITPEEASTMLRRIGRLFEVLSRG